MFAACIRHHGFLSHEENPFTHFWIGEEEKNWKFFSSSPIQKCVVIPLGGVGGPCGELLKSPGWLIECTQQNNCYASGSELLSNSSSVDLLILYACLFPRCGSVIASNAPLLIQRLTVVSSTRKRRATSRTVNNSSLLSSAIILSPAPWGAVVK